MGYSAFTTRGTGDRSLPNRRSRLEECLNHCGPFDGETRI